MYNLDNILMELSKDLPTTIMYKKTYQMGATPEERLAAPTLNQLAYFSDEARLFIHVQDNAFVISFDFETKSEFCLTIKNPVHIKKFLQHSQEKMAAALNSKYKTPPILKKYKDFFNEQPFNPLINFNPHNFGYEVVPDKVIAYISEYHIEINKKMMSNYLNMCLTTGFKKSQVVYMDLIAADKLHPYCNLCHYLEHPKYPKNTQEPSYVEMLNFLISKPKTSFKAKASKILLELNLHQKATIIKPIKI